MQALAPAVMRNLELELQALMNEMATKSEEEAALQGFLAPGTSGRGTGRLIGSIRGGVNLHVDYVRGYVEAHARNPIDGYAYPARYEYQNHGERAFIHPVIDRNRDKIYASLAAAVSRALERFRG